MKSMDNNITHLKQEQIVGNDVVFEDIFPETLSEAVYEQGVPISDIISRLWNAINNKLSRVVNSVNGRTGVVVLKKDDIGLGAVDNVSFADIKQWVVDYLAGIRNHLQLVDSMNDIDQLCASGDKSLNGAPFYAERGYNDDRRPYIGYIYWDEEQEELLHEERAINIPSEGDASIICNEVVGPKDYSNGKIGVNIAPDEEILQILDTGDKSTSGLYLDKTKIGANLVEYEGMYGSGDASDPDALLYFDNGTTPPDAKNVTITIDGTTVQFAGLKIKKTDNLAQGTLILCHFRDYRRYNSSTHVWDVPTGMAPQFMGRTDCIGRVRTIPSEKAQINYYEIDFWTIKVKPGWGMRAETDHQGDIGNQILIPELARSYNNISYVSSNTNFSGLQIFANPEKDQNLTDVDGAVIGTYENPYPSGFTVTQLGTLQRGRVGMGIVTDNSLAINPNSWFSESSNPDATYTDQGEVKYYGSNEIGNWFTAEPFVYNESNTPFTYGVTNQFSTVGINLDKVVQHISHSGGQDPTPFHGSPFRVANMSGLRITKGDTNVGDTRNLRLKEKHFKLYEWFGANANDPIFEADVFEDGIANYMSSGGLSVNVGKYLEIEPGNFPDKAEQYYDGGKINVRIGDGLEGEQIQYEEGHRVKGNRIQVKTADGIEIDDVTKGVKVKIDPERGDLDFDESGNLIVANPAVQTGVLRIKDVDNNTFDFNPSGAPITAETVITELLLGPGLKITTT